MKEFMKELRYRFLEILKKSGWKEKELSELKAIFLGELSKVEVEPDVFEFIVKEIILDKKKNLQKRLEIASKQLGVSEIAVLEILFWYDPSTYPLPSDKMLKLFKGNSAMDFLNFSKDLLKREKVRNFLDLFLKLEGELADVQTQETIVEDLARRINEIDLPFASKVSKYKEIYEILDRKDKDKLLSRLKVHDYVVAGLVRKPKAPLIVDGSNILWFGDLSFRIFDVLFQELSSFETLFFPFKVVFDRNVEYIVPESEKESLKKWLSSPDVLLESPADDLIIDLAVSSNGVILSNDKFKDKTLSRSIRIISPRELLRNRRG
ncbi:MAG: hypothetical protein DRP25_05970 [Thermotoga sp.]|nr:MAG: hypothetical protein DRP25_05970 [Thermotoga sp.]